MYSIKTQQVYRPGTSVSAHGLKSAQNKYEVYSHGKRNEKMRASRLSVFRW